jgi:hypothetical protein
MSRRGELVARGEVGGFGAGPGGSVELGFELLTFGVKQTSQYSERHAKAKRSNPEFF